MPDDVEEVHEDPGAKELVDLLFTGVVTLHEPFDGARFVAAVVVDMHRGVGSVALDDKIDETLEGVALAVSIVAPDGQVVGRRRPRRSTSPRRYSRPKPRSSSTAHGSASMSKKTSSGDGSGSRGEALVGLLGVGLDELVEQLVGILARDLDARLLV